jgi:hypothetical protein
LDIRRSNLPAEQAEPTQPNVGPLMNNWHGFNESVGQKFHEYFNLTLVQCREDPPEKFH